MPGFALKSGHWRCDAHTKTVVDPNSGDFAWIVKDNQANTLRAIEQLFTPDRPRPGYGCSRMDFRSAKTTEKLAGQLEARTVTTSSLLNDYLDWPHLAQVFKLEHHFTCLAIGVVETEVQFELTSLTAEQADPRRLLIITHSECGIENSLHYRRDVTY